MRKNVHFREKMRNFCKNTHFYTFYTDNYEREKNAGQYNEEE